jgi:hypothetical protein
LIHFGHGLCGCPWDWIYDAHKSHNPTSASSRTSWDHILLRLWSLISTESCQVLLRCQTFKIATYQLLKTCTRYKDPSVTKYMTTE